MMSAISYLRKIPIVIWILFVLTAWYGIALLEWGQIDWSCLPNRTYDFLHPLGTEKACIDVNEAIQERERTGVLILPTCVTPEFSTCPNEPPLKLTVFFYLLFDVTIASLILFLLTCRTKPVWKAIRIAVTIFTAVFITFILIGTTLSALKMLVP